MSSNDGSIAFVAEAQDVADAVNLRQQRGFGVWNPKFDLHPPRGKANLQFLEERVHTLASAR